MISCFAEKDLMMDFNYFHYLGNEQYISTSLVQKITSSGMLIYVKTNKTKTQGPGGQASFCISNFHGQKLIIWVPQKNVSSLPRVFKYIATSIWKAIKYNDTKSFGELARYYWTYIIFSCSIRKSFYFTMHNILILS